MKNTFFAAFLFLLIGWCTGSYAQKKIPGKLVMLSGDTLTGVIYDWRSKANPDSVKFIRGSDKKVLMFSPEQLSTIILQDSDVYVIERVKLDMFYSTRRNPLETYARAKQVVFRTVIMHVLVTGRLYLYLYTDENRKDHFFTSPGNKEFRELLFKKVPSKAGEEPHAVTDSRYGEQLKALMADCRVLEKDIDWLHYRERDLVKLFYRYNHCGFSEPVHVSRPVKNRISIHIFAGADIAEFSYTGLDYFSHLENAAFAVSVTPLPGARLIVPLQRQEKKYSLVLDLANRSTWLASKYGYVGEHSTSTYNVHMQMDFVKLNLGFRYKLPTKSVEPYFNGGFALNYLVDFVSSKVQTNRDNLTGQTETIYDVAMQEPHPFDFGFFAGAGFHYKRFNLEGRFEKTTGISPSLELDTHVTTIEVFLSFRLSREE